jgi:DNA-binding transcriptional LysR family regulator
MTRRFRSWSDVRVFLAVVREGSTLAASRSLEMAQPTVARRIDALEHETGLVLFERDPRGFHATAAAQALVPVAEALEQAAGAFETTAEGLSRPAPIRVTAAVSNFSPRVTEIFTEFSALHPEVDFEFLSSVRTLDLIGGEADVALRVTRSEPDPRLVRRLVSTARFTVYGSAAYAAMHGLPDRPEALQGHVFVDYAREDVRFSTRDWLLRHVTPDRITITFGETQLVDAAIRSGRALGIANVRRMDEDEAAGKVVRCFDPPEDWSAPHYLLISPQAWRRTEVKTFVKFFAPRYARIFK